MFDLRAVKYTHVNGEFHIHQKTRLSDDWSSLSERNMHRRSDKITSSDAVFKKLHRFSLAITKSKYDSLQALKQEIPKHHDQFYDSKLQVGLTDSVQQEQHTLEAKCLVSIVMPQKIM